MFFQPSQINESPEGASDIQLTLNFPQKSHSNEGLLYSFQTISSRIYMPKNLKSIGVLDMCKASVVGGTC